MAVPSYTEDLTDITLAEAITGFTAVGGGASGLGTGADLSFQGTLAVDKAVSASEKGMLYDNGATITNTTGKHFYIWIALGTPGLANTLANRGLAATLGTSITAYTRFAVEGSDTYGAAGRIAKVYPIRYDNTAGTNRTLVGTPGANPQWFGATANITATAKGSNLGIDAIRHGTGAFLTAGELISAGDASNDPCTFTGFQTQNDSISNRWGILTLVGSSYELQGKFAMGQNNTGTATLCRFRDSDKTIVIPNNLHAASDFSQFIVDHASTRVEWTNINIEALGTINKGLINVINTSSIFIVVGGTYTGIGTTVLRAGCDFTGVTWRQSDLVTLNGASVTGCTFDRLTSASSVLASTLADITECEFISDGSNHAVELTSVGGGSMDWANTSSGYVAGVSGNNVSSSSTGNEDIYLNFTSATTFTINVLAGATVPSIRKAAGMTGNVNIVAGTVTLNLTVQNTSGTPIENARALVTAGVGGSYPGNVTVTITTVSTTATVSHTTHGLSNGDKVLITGANENELNGIRTISNVTANTYDYTITSIGGASGTGTIKSSFVIISGLTNASGVISDSRVYSTNQPLGADSKVRKSSVSPFYKTGAVVGTVNSATGANITVILLDDE